MITFKKLQPIKKMINTTGCLLDYLYFKEHCKMITVDLSQQQQRDVDLKATEQINFIENLDRDENVVFNNFHY